MSFRFHKTAPLVTLYHNPKSATSLRALALLRSAQQSGDVVAKSESQSLNTESPAKQFLREAASSSHGLELYLEVKERSKEPPTPGQLQTILGYLKHAEEDPNSGASRTSREKQAATVGSQPVSKSTSRSPADLSPGEIRSRIQAYPAASSSPADKNNPMKWTQLDDSSLVSQLQASELLLVDWDNGRAVTDLNGVQQLLNALKAEQADRVQRESGTRSGGGCIVV